MKFIGGSALLDEVHPKGHRCRVNFIRSDGAAA